MNRRKYPALRKFSGTKPGLLHPPRYNDLVDYCIALKAEIADLTPESSSDIGIRHTGGGWIAFLKRHGSGSGAGAACAGPFCKVYKNEAGTSWMLLGGVVSGGSGNETIAPINIGSVSSPPSDGQRRWLSVSFTATTEDGVLLPGGDVTSASVGSGTSLPSNTIPTAASPGGTVRVPLGVWSQGKFIPSGCGDVTVGHCPGSLTYNRG